MIRNADAAKLIVSNRLIIFLAFFLLGFLIYSPVLNKSFSSDDFLVLKRVCIDKQLFLEGFFRPLSDISLYFSYWIGGFDPFFFTTISIFLHILCAFLIYIFVCLSTLVTPDKRYLVAFAAGLLFLFYPFHNESVVWGVGRGSELATLFALLSLIVLQLNWKPWIRYSTSALLYFIALSAYESIVFLPVIALVLVHDRQKSKQNYIIFGLAFTVALIGHIYLRIHYSESVAGDYGAEFFSTAATTYFFNFFKSIARLFIPPIWNSTLFLGIAVLLISSIFVSLSYLLLKAKSEYRLPILKLMLAVLFSISVPVVFSISTKTSESDRFLYFPSVFICFLLSYLINYVLANYKRKILALTMLLGYFLLCLQLNNSHWIRASVITTQILHKIKVEAVQGKTILIVNLPDEYRGAFIFQNGFNEALEVNRIPQSYVFRINNLTIEESSRFHDSIPIKYSATEIALPPNTIISKDDLNQTWRIGAEGADLTINSNETIVLFWNNRRLVKVDIK